MRNRSLWLLAGLVLVASLLIGPGATAGTERASAGTVVFIHDQEPPNLQGPWVGNNLYATALVLNNIWYGCQIRNDTAAWVPRLCTGKPQLIKKSPMTVKFTYKPDAEWSDGKEVTAADFRATWQVFINPANNVISRTGYEDIKSVGGGNGKTVTVVFKKTYAAWESLVSGGPYPAHIIAGKNMNDMFLNSVPVSSGPWLFDSWNKGQSITVKKNPRFKASIAPPMKLDRIVFRYILDTNARFQSLKANEGQVMEPQPQLQIEDFMKDSKFVVNRKVGYTYEHIDIQFGPKGHPALKQPYIRRALITGMNRSQVAASLYKEIAPGLPPLQSLMFKPFETAAYKKNFAVWRFNQRAVIANLKAHGCTGGPDTPKANNSDIFSCPNVGKLSFRFHTTTGNQLRALTFEIIQRQLKSVGIELVAPVPDGRRDVRHHAAVPRLGPDAVRVGRLARLADHHQGHLRLRWRPERRRLLQPGAVQGPEPGLDDARRNSARKLAERGRAQVHGQGHPLDPDVRAAGLRDPLGERQGSGREPDPRGQPVEREHLDAVTRSKK